MEPGVGELDYAKSSPYQAHREINLAAKNRKFLWCVLCLVLLLPLSLGKQCNQNEAFSLNAFIKITYCSGPKPLEPHLICCAYCLGIWSTEVLRHSNVSGNPDRMYKRGCLFFLGIFTVPWVLSIHKSS